MPPPAPPELPLIVEDSTVIGPTSRRYRPPPHLHAPGAVWLPDTVERVMSTVAGAAWAKTPAPLSPDELPLTRESTMLRRLAEPPPGESLRKIPPPSPVPVAALPLIVELTTETSQPSLAMPPPFAAVELPLIVASRSVRLPSKPLQFPPIP